MLVVQTRMRSSFIVGMVLSLSLQAKGITYCPTVPAGAIVRRQKLDEERREQEQRDQLNKLLNERIKQGKMIEITTDENVKLLIKRRKMVDKNKNQEMSLSEAIALVAFAGFFAFLPFFSNDFFHDTKRRNNPQTLEKPVE